MEVTPALDQDIRRIVLGSRHTDFADEIVEVILVRLTNIVLREPLEHYFRCTVRLETQKRLARRRRYDRRLRSLRRELHAILPRAYRPACSPLTQLIQSEQREAIDKACRAMPPMQRDAIRCYYGLDGPKQGREEFASRWNCGPKAFYRSRDAGLRRLRKELRGYGD